MGDASPQKRRPIRTGLGILLMVLGADGLYTLFRPAPGMMRPDNSTEFAVMLLVPLAVAIWGVVMIATSVRRQKRTGSDPP